MSKFLNIENAAREHLHIEYHQSFLVGQLKKTKVMQNRHILKLIVFKHWKILTYKVLRFWQDYDQD